MTDNDPALTPELMITADDVVELNRATVLRAAAFARIGGTAIIGAGVIGVLGWLWLTVRNQQHIEGSMFGGFDSSDDTAFIDRIDALVSFLPFLMYSSLALGLGLGLRMLADYAVVKTGGSATGFEVGDVLTDDEPSADGAGFTPA